MFLFLAVIISYLIGSIPIGFIICKIKGIDIRQIGSGNPGATNVRRALGNKAGIITLSLDALKGFTVIVLFSKLYLKFSPEISLYWINIFCGLSVIGGHNWSLFLKFKGGKGVATSAGVMMAIAPFELFICLIFFIVIVFISKYVSLGSIAAALLLPILFFIQEKPLPYFILALVASTFVIFRHKENLLRLKEGKENKIGVKNEKK